MVEHAKFSRVIHTSTAARWWVQTFWKQREQNLWILGMRVLSTPIAIHKLLYNHELKNIEVCFTNT